jgi:hypothetical protein
MTHPQSPTEALREALQHIDAELTQYLEGMPADETSRRLRDLARSALSHPQQSSEPVGHVFTMEALTPGGSVKCHAALTRDLPAGTLLYTHPQQPSGWRDISPEGWKLVPVKATGDMLDALLAPWFKNPGGSERQNLEAGYAGLLAAAPAHPAEQQEGDEEAAHCPRCCGSGTITVSSDSSPDAHDVDVDCDHCGGTGSAADAATRLAGNLAQERMRHMQLYGEYQNFHRSLCERFGYSHDTIHFRRDLVSLEEAIAALVKQQEGGDAVATLRVIHPGAIEYSLTRAAHALPVGYYDLHARAPLTGGSNAE